MAFYLPFEHIDAGKELRGKFLQQASGLNLNLILTKNKKGLHCTFHKALNMNNVYLVMIVGSYDELLIRLGQECHLPRGFPILWIPDVRMHYFGFYPKFDNDDRQTPDDLSEFSDVTALRFFKKFSGFLGQLMVFKINENIYWTVASKNSADHTSEFVQECKRLFTPFIIPKLVTAMSNQNLHICAEMMSKNDQTHGARVINESALVTCIGEGYRVDLTKEQPASQFNAFVKYFTHNELVVFCHEYNLHCDTAIVISDKVAAQGFLKALSQKRDSMTDWKLFELISYNYQGKIIGYQGTIGHNNILGNCLEGIVLILSNAKGEHKTKKYKFPNYTIRTMLLREEFENFMFTSQLKEKAQGFVNHWCVTPEGKKYWYKFALQCFIKYLSFKTNDKTVGVHIQIADSIVTDDHDVESEFDQTLISISKGTVVLFIGPIGSGKSTGAGSLVKMNPEKFVHIDGDVLDLDTKLVLKLGKERNDYSRWQVIKALMSGKVPILSTGGGILFSSGKKQVFMLLNQIYHMLGIVVKIIVFVPCNSNQIIKLDKQTHTLDEFYNNENIVKSTVTRRVKNGEWAVDPKFQNSKASQEKIISNFANFIFVKSKSNLQFAQKIMEASNAAYGFPVVTEQNYNTLALDFSQVLPEIIYPTPIEIGKLQQIRILTLINENTIGHITWMHLSNDEDEDDMTFSLNDFKLLEDMYSKEITGNIITMVSEATETNKISFAVPDESIHGDKSTHITVNPGPHEAKKMKTVVRELNAGKNIIQIPTSSGQMISYDVNTMIKEKCTIRILGTFGM
jgi:hypothetical protein